MNEEVEFFEFMRKKKLNIKDLIYLFGLFEIKEMTVIGNEGLKQAIIDNLNYNNIKVNVERRYS